MHRHLLRNLALAFVFCCTVLGMLSHAVADTNSYTYVWNGSAWVPVSSSNPIPINGSITSTTPAPAPTVSPGLVNGAVVIGPSTAPAAINGAYTVVVDSNGRIATRICDATTSTQCVAVSAGGVLSVTTNLPYPGTPQSQSFLANSFLGVGGSDQAGHFQPLFVNAAGGINSALSGTTVLVPADAVSNAANAGQSVFSFNAGFNGTTWDRLRTAAAPTGAGTGILATTTSSGTASAPVACDSFAAVNISSATTTSIVAVSGSKAVYICAYHLYIVSGTLPSLKFEYGTGAACVTTQTVMSGTFGGIAGAVGTSFEIGSGVGAVLQTPASQAFCIVSGGTTPNIQGFVTYSQF